MYGMILDFICCICCTLAATGFMCILTCCLSAAYLLSTCCVLAITGFMSLDSRHNFLVLSVFFGVFCGVWGCKPSIHACATDKIVFYMVMCQRDGVKGDLHLRFIFCIDEQPDTEKFLRWWFLRKKRVPKKGESVILVLLKMFKEESDCRKNRRKGKSIEAING